MFDKDGMALVAIISDDKDDDSDNYDIFISSLAQRFDSRSSYQGNDNNATSKGQSGRTNKVTYTLHTFRCFHDCSHGTAAYLVEQREERATLFKQ